MSRCAILTVLSFAQLGGPKDPPTATVSGRHNNKAVTFPGGMGTIVQGLALAAFGSSQFEYEADEARWQTATKTDHILIRFSTPTAIAVNIQEGGKTYPVAELLVPTSLEGASAPLAHVSGNLVDKYVAFGKYDPTPIALLRERWLAASPSQPQIVDAPAPPKVSRDRVNGSINHHPETVWNRTTGKVKVIDAETMEFGDGTRESLGFITPDLAQKGRIDGKWYPCGKEAAEFLRQRIGDRPVTIFRAGGTRLYVEDENLEHTMVVNGWALADHSSLHAAEIIAREHKRGLWRGEFVNPADWRNGKRLPSE